MEQERGLLYQPLDDANHLVVAGSEIGNPMEHRWQDRKEILSMIVLLLPSLQRFYHIWQMFSPSGAL